MPRRSAILLAALLSLLPAAAPGQSTGVARRASVPLAGDLERVNLKLAWRMNLPMTDRFDTVVYIQPIEDQVFVTLGSGTLVAVNAANGEEMWRKRFTNMPSNLYPVRTNDAAVLVVHGRNLHCYERRLGGEIFNFELPSTPTAPVLMDGDRIYVFLGDHRILNYEMPSVEPVTRDKFKPRYNAADTRSSTRGLSLTASEVPDERRFPTSLSVRLGSGGGNIAASRTPSIQAISSMRPPYTTVGSRTPSIGPVQTSRPPYIGQPNPSPSLAAVPSLHQLAKLTDIRVRDVEPELRWSYSVDLRVERGSLIMTRDNFRYVLIASAERVVFALQVEYIKDRRRLEVPTRIYEREHDAPITAPMAQYDSQAFICTANEFIVALRIADRRYPQESGRIRWRLSTQGVVRRKPLVSDDTVYYVVDDVGAQAVDSETGTARWQVGDRRLDRIVAASPKHVYAVEERGQLAILDRGSGYVLGRFDLSDFPVSATNEQDDRMYFAAPNGLLLCLHDRDFPTPQAINKLAKLDWTPPVLRAEPPAKKEEAPKEDAPKADAPKADAPKVDAPKADAPKADAPKKEPAPAPKGKEPAPKKGGDKMEMDKKGGDKMEKDAGEGKTKE